MWYMLGFLAYILFISAGYLLIRASSQLNDANERDPGLGLIRDEHTDLKAVGNNDGRVDSSPARNSSLIIAK